MVHNVHCSHGYAGQNVGASNLQSFENKIVGSLYQKKRKNWELDPSPHSPVETQTSGHRAIGIAIRECHMIAKKGAYQYI